MTLAGLISAFRSLSGDNVEPYLWTDDEITGWLNEAEQEACIRARLIRDNTASRCEIEVVEGTATYTLHASHFEIAYAELEDSGGTIYELGAVDRLEMDRLRPGWRTEVMRPEQYIHDDKTLTLTADVDDDYTLRIEAYRLPLEDMALDADEPEIAAIHHRELVHWALYRGYSKPDADGLNPGKAAESEARFEKYFGKRPGAKARRSNYANRPHRNKPCW